MSRQQHDVVNDHFGVLDDAQIASGTPADGDVPTSNGDGTRTWGPGGGGGGSVHLADDTTTFSEDGIVFTGGFTYFGADGNDATQYATISLEPDLIETYSQASADAYAYIDVSSSGAAGGVDIYAQTDGSTYSNLSLVAGNSTFYGSGFVQFNPIVINMPNLPTSDPANPGQLWVDSGVLKVSL